MPRGLERARRHPTLPLLLLLLLLLAAPSVAAMVLPPPPPGRLALLWGQSSRGLRTHRTLRRRQHCLAGLASAGSNEATAAAPRTKRKVALVIGYVGSDFAGLQIHRELKTRSVESVLEKALFDAGAISQDNYGELSKIGWRRTSRTDKGVHAARSVVVAKLVVDPDSFDEMGVSSLACQEINAVLPPDIRVYSVAKVPRSFSGRAECTFRDYEYIFPRALLPDSASYQHFGSILQGFVGSHNFCNFCTLKEKRLKEVQRQIRALKDDGDQEESDGRLPLKDRILLQEQVTTVYTMEVEELQGTDKEMEQELCRVRIRGQGFLYNQIRYMIGAALMEAGALLPKGTCSIALHTSLAIDLFKAPPEGLVLTGQGFTGSANCAVMDPRNLGTLAGQLTSWEIHDPAHDTGSRKIPSKGRAQALMSREGMKASQDFYQHRILPRISRDWGVGLAEEWRAEVGGLMSSFYEEDFLDLYAKEGAERLAIWRQKTRAELQKHDGKRLRAFGSETSKSRLKDYLPRGLTAKLVSRYDIMPGDGVAAMQRALIRIMADAHLRKLHGGGGRDFPTEEELAGFPHLAQDADLDCIVAYIDGVGPQRLLKMGGFRSCIEGMQDSELLRLGVLS